MRAHFPILDKCVYLNTAYVGLPSTGLMDYRTSYDKNYLTEADHFKIKGYERLESQRQTLSSFIGSQYPNTFITPNFSVGFRLFLDFLPSDTRFLILKEDYPSLETAIRERGFSVEQVPMGPHVEEVIATALQEGKFDVLAVSVVQYTNGVYLNQQALVNIKKRFPNILILADGTQFLGAELFTFDASPFDLIAASGYKWFLAGFGNGLVTVNSRFIDYCQTSFETIAAKVYAGHFDFLGAASLAFAVRQLEAWNFPRLVEQKNQTTTYLKKGLEKRELLSPMVQKRKDHAAIFNIAATEDFYQQLLVAGVRCSYRAQGVRISVHFYNTTEDIDAFFAVYDRLV